MLGTGSGEIVVVGSSSSSVKVGYWDWNGHGLTLLDDDGCGDIRDVDGVGTGSGIVDVCSGSAEI